MSAEPVDRVIGTDHAACFLDRPENLPLRPASAALAFGRTCVIAPHPDDESLGCGGAVALLRRARIPVFVLFLSDGTGSHPSSRAYPPERLRDLREQEARSALTCLGVPDEMCAFLRFRDTAVPGEGTARFGEAVARCQDSLATFMPDTVLVPWRRDYHCDHRAAWEIVRVAVANGPMRPRLVEYPIWVYDHLHEAHAPRPGEIAAWRLDISAAAAAKHAAVYCHRSQLTDLIADDPAGFRLMPAVLARFMRLWEVYLEDAHD